MESGLIFKTVSQVSNENGQITATVQCSSTGTVGNLSIETVLNIANPLDGIPSTATVQGIKIEGRLKVIGAVLAVALYKAKGITPDMVKAQITDPKQLIEFEYANEYFRGNPLIDLIGEKLGYTTDELDYLFLNKEFV